MLDRKIESSAIMLNNWLSNATILNTSSTPLNGYSIASLTDSGRSDRVLWYGVSGQYIQLDYDLKTPMRPTAFFLVDFLYGPWDTNRRFRQQISSYLANYPIYITGADDSAFSSNIVVGQVATDSNGQCVGYLGADQNPGQYSTSGMIFGPLIVNADDTVHIAYLSGVTAASKIVKLNTAGILDTTYGTAGTYTTGTIGSGSILTYSSTKSAADPVFVGESSASSSGDMLIYRLTPNTSGTPYVLDTAFNTTGYNTFSQDDASKRHIAYAVAPVETTKYIVAGYATSSSNLESFALTKINSNGTIDTAFGTSGHKLISGFPSEAASRDDRCYGVTANNSASKIRAVGSVSTGAGTSVAGICQMSLTGTLDSGFGTGGLMELNLGNARKRDVALAVADRGSIFSTFFIGGYGSDPASAGQARGWVTKLNAVSTTPPTTFNGGNTVVLNEAFTKIANARISVVRDIIVPSDSNPRIAAIGTDHGAIAIFVIKMDGVSGALDPSFGRLGGVGSHLVQNGTIKSVKMFIDSVGNIFVSYSAANGPTESVYYSMVVKFDSNGMEETSWGSGYISTPKRYWRIQAYDAALTNSLPTSISNVYLGDSVDIRPDFQTSISLTDRSKSLSSWSGYQYTDRITPSSEVSLSATNMLLSEKNAIEDYCQNNGPESFGVLDLLGGENDLEEKSDHLFFGNLDSRGGFSSSRKTSSMYDVRIKFIEDPK